MRAASAKAVSFFDASVFSDIIFVKFTNCTRIKEKCVGTREVLIYSRFQDKSKFGIPCGLSCQF